MILCLTRARSFSNIVSRIFWFVFSLWILNLESIDNSFFGDSLVSEIPRRRRQRRDHIACFFSDCFFFFGYLYVISCCVNFVFYVFLLLELLLKVFAGRRSSNASSLHLDMSWSTLRCCSRDYGRWHLGEGSRLTDRGNGRRDTNLLEASIVP